MDASKPKRKLPWQKSAVQPKKRSTTQSDTSAASRATTSTLSSSSSAKSSSSTSARRPSRKKLGRGRVAQAKEEESEEEENDQPDDSDEDDPSYDDGAQAKEKNKKTKTTTKAPPAASERKGSSATASVQTTTTKDSEPHGMEELPTQLDVPLLGHSTQLDELPTQIDLPCVLKSNSTERTRPSNISQYKRGTTSSHLSLSVQRKLELPSSPSSSPSPSPGAGRSPSLSPDPYRMLAEEATQLDAPHWPQESLPSSPRSPIVQHMDSPTQADGPRSPFPLSPMASPLADRSSLPSSPIALLSKRTRRNKFASTTTTATKTSSGSAPLTSSQWHGLMSQPTQSDLPYSPSASPLPSQGDSSVVYDDLLTKATQADYDYSGSPADLLSYPTQSDCAESALLSAASPIRRPNRLDKRSKPKPYALLSSPMRYREKRNCEGTKTSEDASPETSLLLLDTSTQDDDVDCGHDIAEDASESEAEEYRGDRKAPSKRYKESDSLDSSLTFTPTPEEKPTLLHAPTQLDLLNISTQADQSLVLDAEESTIGSMPTQADGFSLLSPTQAESTMNMPTQMDLPTHMDLPTQIDVTASQADAGALLPTTGRGSCQLSAEKQSREVDKAAEVSSSAALVDPLDYEPTPPLEMDEGSPGCSMPNKSKKRKAEEAISRNQTTEARRKPQQADEELVKKKQNDKNRVDKSRPGFGDHQEEEKAPFGKIVSLNPTNKHAVIPAEGVLIGRHSTCTAACRFPKNAHISTKHCRISVVQGSPSSSQSAGEESNDAPSVELAPADAPLCRYGESCYRKNPQHLKEFRHPSKVEKPAPASFEIEVEDMSTNGTYINGVLIGKNCKQKLQPDDVLSLVVPIFKGTGVTSEIAYRYARN